MPSFTKKLLKKYHPVPTIAWGLFIFILCLLPSSALPDAGWAAAYQPDKWVHAILYFLWYCIALGGNDKISNFKTISAMILFGAGIELFQEFILTYRSGEWLDWAADGVGLGVGLVFIRWKNSRHKKDF